MGLVELTPQMVLVLAILALTIYLFVSEVVRVDVAAIIIMVLIGLTNLFRPITENGKTYSWLQYHFPDTAASSPGLDQLFSPLVGDHALFSGFGSNAVISIIAVMILGAGLDRTGIMSKVANFILRIGGSTEKRVIPLISGTVGGISGFMQNVGAAALFLPVVSRISARTRIPMSRLLMPMGFCAIMGGTLTMIGSSPLILLNDLILKSNKSLPDNVDPMASIGMLEVTPVGLALVATGILYFVLAGRFILPSTKQERAEPGSTIDYIRDEYGIEGALYEVGVTLDSALIGMTVEDISNLDNSISVIALHNGEQVMLAPARDEHVWVGSQLAVLGEQEHVEDFALRHKLDLKKDLQVLGSQLSPQLAGIAEIVVPPRSGLVGKTVRDIRMAKTYGANLLAVHRSGQTVRQDRRDLTLVAGDTLIVHASWRDLHAIAQNHRDFIVVTDYPHEDTRPHKVPHALTFFLIAMFLVLGLKLQLSIGLLVGAIGMIVTGVLRVSEAYDSVDWKTVFLLASLIPLGQAVNDSGTAEWIAQHTLTLLGGVPIWVLQAAIAVLATVFTLVMSNVGATVLLVPLAVNIAIGAGADPRLFALTVALATSNSFLIPTHQVNALIMGPAGYRVADFMRAGGIMTVLFLVVMLSVLNLIF